MAAIVIVGGGLAGLSCGLLLSRFGYETTIVEKREFPFHKVCGEYVSNEVLPFLSSLGIDIHEHNPSSLTRLNITSASGKKTSLPLDLGGFGLSRYRFDQLLYRRAVDDGVKFLTGTKVTDINYSDNRFRIQLPHGELYADIVIGAYGKRSNLDQKLKRQFFYHRSPYMGVKYHVQTEFPEDVIQLDLFPGGYSGICKIEDEKYSLCYLTCKENLKSYKSLAEMEQNVLCRNSFFKDHYENSDFAAQPSEVISEVSFEPKPLVENHILFCGDSAGMISPLYGNGMAMAIHGGKILAENIHTCLKKDPFLVNRSVLEYNYRRHWQRLFQSRMLAGRGIQKLFLQPYLAEAGLLTLRSLPGFAHLLMKKSHGRPF